MNRKTAPCRLAFILAAIAIFTAPARAEGDSPPVRRLDATIHSGVLAQDVTVSIYLPASYDRSDARYPSLYVLEDDLYNRAMTGMIDTWTRLGSMPEVIVVGIPTSDRWRDFTPTHAGVPGGEVIPTSGGAADHRTFMSRELIPYVEENFRTQPFRMLFGHSVAGLHVITTMLEDRDLFGAYMATSPSLWWDGETATAMAKTALGPGTLFLALGGEGETMEAPLDRFCDVLEARAPAGLRWTRFDYPGAEHAEVPIRAFCDALDFVYADWVLPGEVLASGLEAVDAHFDRLSDRFGYRIEVPEAVINRMGYRRMNAGDLDGAIALFRRNAETYPGSANVHDSLGEAYLARGDLESARARYVEALRLDPSSASARSALERINADASSGAAAER